MFSEWAAGEGAHPVGLMKIGTVFWGSSRFRERHRGHCLWILVVLALQTSCEWFGPPTFHITAEEFRFTPSNIEWPPFHPVRLLIRNQGREPHVFHSPLLFGPEATVTWHQPKMAVGDTNAILLKPGQSVELTLALAPGMYPFRCWIKGHTGMEGTISVKDSS